MVNGQDMSVQLIGHTKPYNNFIFQIDGASDTSVIGPLTNFGLLFPVMCLCVCYCVCVCVCVCVCLVSLIGDVLSVIKAYLYTPM